ncbi:hypothetical protein Cantr_04270 [Candida viswanathii]|uniref:Uncharacterized protein n=1 Tax=Candida viswanathii TaxID=5486 RepID=A0A367XLR3_9ASCO|nr:hypothetical protein Cantr_04270 [Candida viswanathii]
MYGFFMVDNGPGGFLDEKCCEIFENSIARLQHDCPDPQLLQVWCMTYMDSIGGRTIYRDIIITSLAHALHNCGGANTNTNTNANANADGNILVGLD